MTPNSSTVGSEFAASDSDFKTLFTKERVRWKTVGIEFRKTLRENGL
jgi:hypothetical protein